MSSIKIQAPIQDCDLMKTAILITRNVDPKPYNIKH